MKKLGAYMLFFGIGSIVLNYFNMQFIILSWIDTWGTTVGLGIRIGLIVGGAVLMLVAKKNAVAPASP